MPDLPDGFFGHLCNQEAWLGCVVEETLGTNDTPGDQWPVALLAQHRGDRSMEVLIRSDQECRWSATPASLLTRMLAHVAPIHRVATTRDALRNLFELGGYPAHLIHAVKALFTFAHEGNREAQQTKLAREAMAIHPEEITTLEINGIVEFAHTGIEHRDNSATEIFAMVTEVDDREVVTTNMPEEIFARGDLGQHAREHMDSPIAPCKAIRIVKGFEVIQIDVE